MTRNSGAGRSTQPFPATEQRDLETPEVVAPVPDAAYLAEALGRAGRPGSAAGGQLRIEPLEGGRSGVQVVRLCQSEAPAFVLKQIPRRRAFRDALQHEGEGLAWLAGITRAPPSPLANPTLDVALNTHRDEWWLLMSDVSRGIQPRGQWRESHSRQLFEAMADFHANWWGVEPGPSAGVASLAQTTGLLVEVARHAGRGEAATPWAARAGQEFQVPRLLLPDFLEAVDDANADFYLDLLDHWPDLVQALAAYPATLLHGDLRRANIAFVDGRIALLDWELASRGPAAADLTWHWFLHYWAYAPNDSRSPDHRLWLRDAYLHRLEQSLGQPVDRRAFLVSWELGWLRVFCQLGFLLADGLDDHRPARLKLISRAFEQARRIADEHLG